MTTDDTALVKQVLAGNKAAFGPLIDRHWPRAMRLALRQMGNLSDAEDVVQDAFLQAMMGLPTLRTPNRFGSWLLGIVSNLCRMRWRSWKNNQDLEKWENTILVPDSSGSAACPSPESLYETHESQRLLLAALATLPVEQQQAIRLHYLEGLPLSEISLLEKASVGAVKVRLHRARTRLRRALGGEAIVAQNLITHKDKEFYMIKSTGQDTGQENGQHGTIFPLIPTRDIVVFPHMTVPLFLGRPKSIKAVEEATAHNTQLFLTAQRDAAVNNPTQEHIYPVGTLASISGQVYFPDGTLKMLVTGERRGRLLRQLEHEDFLQVEVEEIDEQCEPTPEIGRLLSTAKERYQHYLDQKNKGVPLSTLLAIQAIHDPAQLSDTIIPQLKLTIDIKQHLFEILDPIERLKKLLDTALGVPDERDSASLATPTTPGGNTVEDIMRANLTTLTTPENQPGSNTIEGIIRTYFGGWWTRDIDLLLDSVAGTFWFDECHMTTPRYGRPQFKEYLTQLFAAFPDLTKIVMGMSVCETHVWVEWIMKGTHQGEFQAITPTQKTITIRGASMLDVQEGKIVSERSYWDKGDLLRQLGRGT